MLLGHRYFDCSIGRFISRDPIQAGDNWYAYCENNPLVRQDPSGLDDAEHRSNKKNWDKHTGPRAGGAERKDGRMKFGPPKRAGGGASPGKRIPKPPEPKRNLPPDDHHTDPNDEMPKKEWYDYLNDGLNNLDGGFGTYFNTVVAPQLPIEVAVGVGLIAICTPISGGVVLIGSASPLMKYAFGM